MDIFGYTIRLLSTHDILMLGIVLFCLVMIVDDIFIDFLAFFGNIKPHKMRPDEFTRMYSLEERKIAIFMANWHEDQVLEPMVAGNIKGVNYTNYKIIIGVYPNDIPTLNAARRLEKKFPDKIESFVNTKDGPTSKGQLINLMAKWLDDYNQTPGNIPYDLIITHDAEDVIHKDSLKLINMRSRDYGFIQIPVYSLPIPITLITAGIYIDEFVECHNKDILVRDFFDAGFPGAGVGIVTSYKVMKMLFDINGGEYLKEKTLAEDYFLGLACHEMKVPSKFVCEYYEVRDPKTRKVKKEYIATRELFPQKVKQSIRQKTRWTLGVAIQGMTELNWKRPNAFATYFILRDRKGLINAPLFSLSVLFSAYFIYFYFSTGAWPILHYQPYRQLLATMMWSIVMFSALRILNRILLVHEIYGTRMALMIPVRWVCSNFINTACTYSAIHQWANSHFRGIQPKWSKTEHFLPEGYSAANLDFIEDAPEASPAGTQPLSKFGSPTVSV